MNSKQLTAAADAAEARLLTTPAKQRPWFEALIRDLRARAAAL